MADWRFCWHGCENRTRVSLLCNHLWKGPERIQRGVFDVVGRCVWVCPRLRYPYRDSIVSALRTLASLIGDPPQRRNSTLSSTPTAQRGPTGPCCVNSQLEIVFVNWRRWNMSFLFLYRYVSS